MTRVTIGASETLSFAAGLQVDRFVALIENLDPVGINTVAIEESLAVTRHKFGNDGGSGKLASLLESLEANTHPLISSLGNHAIRRSILLAYWNVEAGVVRSIVLPRPDDVNRLKQARETS